MLSIRYRKLWVDRGWSTTVLRLLERDITRSVAMLCIQRARIHGVRVAMLGRNPLLLLCIQQYEILQIFGVHCAMVTVPVAWLPKTRNQTIWYEIAVILPTIIQRVKPGGAVQGLLVELSRLGMCGRELSVMSINLRWLCERSVAGIWMGNALLHRKLVGSSNLLVTHSLEQNCST